MNCSVFDVTNDDFALVKTFSSILNKTGNFSYQKGASFSGNICMTVINISELRKALHSTVFSKLLLKNKATVNTVLPLAQALLHRTFKENAPDYILFTHALALLLMVASGFLTFISIILD